MTDVGHPIIYVRGYAGSQSEVEETTADPYMGFNVGSTKARQRWTSEIERFIFESPLIRLMKDEGYVDGFRNGAELPPHECPPRRTVFVYRYYEQVSKDLGTGERPEIETFAEGLDTFIEALRDRYCGVADGADDARRAARRDFRVNLVAHSMGGLVCRCYLQNIRVTAHAARVANGRADAADPVPVDKLFTYATPHGGIDLRLIGNLPGFLTANNVDNFNRARMRDYLKLGPNDPVHSIGPHFDAERCFCMVGTNHRDYTVARGLSSFAVGASSDGLVRIENAAVRSAPRAFTHRAHSGHYGIVNSEEGYQNLRRFLFGNVRVDAFLEVDDLSLPPAVRHALEERRKIRASYHIESVVSVRGARWNLHRRLVDEQSAKFVDYERASSGEPIQLASTFLILSEAHNKRRLGFSLDLRIEVPDYEVERDGILGWFGDQHFEGGHLYREKLNFDLVRSSDGPPEVAYGLDSRTPNRVGRSTAERTPWQGVEGGYEFRIDIAQNTEPGFKGRLLLRSRPWNA